MSFSVTMPSGLAECQTDSWKACATSDPIKPMHQTTGTRIARTTLCFMRRTDLASIHRETPTSITTGAIQARAYDATIRRVYVTRFFYSCTTSKWWHPLPGAPVRFRVKGSHQGSISDSRRGSGLSTHALFAVGSLLPLAVLGLVLQDVVNAMNKIVLLVFNPLHHARERETHQF